jgi:hypothetical protein
LGVYRLRFETNAFEVLATRLAYALALWVARARSFKKWFAFARVATGYFLV